MIRTPGSAVILAAILATALAIALPPILAQEPPRAPARGAAQEAVQASAQSAVSMPRTWLQGFVKAVSGDSIVYPWAYPGQATALLSRATDGRMRVAWVGEAVPPGAPDEFMTYLWHAGTASGSGAHAFTFSINDTPIATFRSGRTAEDREWAVTGAGGATLSFRTTRVGAFGELFGFMWVIAPRSVFGAGAPRFSVAGEAANSQDYYLGPEEEVRTYVRVRPEEAVFSSGERAVRVEVSSAADPEDIRIEAGGSSVRDRTRTGYWSALVPAGPNIDRNLAVSITVGTRAAVSETLALKAVKARSLHLLPHSHVDIGYSDPQPVVERKQWKNLRDAVELGRTTASYLPEARFKWNVEGLWSVESYLKQAGAEERAAFLEAVRTGTISLQANDTNILTGLATPEELRRWTDGSRRLRAAYGLAPMRTAMHSDIPGLSWTSVAALAESGVRYVSSGPNYQPGLPDNGDRIGATLRALGDKPFWWASPSGEDRLLFWMAGRGYSWFHGLNMGRLTAQVRDAVLEYVKALADGGYPYDMVQVRYTIGGDNGPVDPSLPDAVKAWNEQFASPRLVINTADAMFEEFERKYGTSIPVMSGDMTPYWEDGAISSAAEEAMGRAAARRLVQAEALWALRRPEAFPAGRAEEAWRNVILWHEHTWGAADSISQPDRADVVAQWEYKRAFALAADRLSSALLKEAAPAPGVEIEVVNTLAWPRSGLVYIAAAQSTAGDRVRASAGRVLPSQRMSDGRLAVWVDEVPALGSIRLVVEAGAPGAPRQALTVKGGVLDNGRLQLVLEAATGAIARLVWHEAPNRSVTFGSPESRSRISHPGPVSLPGQPTTPAIGLTWRPGSGRRDVLLSAGALFSYVYVPGRDPSAAAGSGGGRTILDDAGPLVAVARVDGPAPGTFGMRRTLRLVAGSDLVEIDIAIDKARVRTKESAHVAFPLNVPDGVTRVDLGEALVEPERDQLPGSCRDFIGAHSAVDVSNATVGVSLATLDAPLVEPGAITDERQVARGTRAWRERTAAGTTLYAYLLNNYWHTNYRAYQEGPLTYRFALRPHGAFDPVALRRFSDEQDQPLLVFPIDPAAPEARPPFALTGDPVTLSSLRVADGGGAIVARLFNPAARTAMVIVRPATAGARVSIVGPDRLQAVAGGRIALPAHATRVVRIE
jgi:hypothetical protein